MAPATIPETEPVDALAGFTWRWNRAVADYSPADGWTLKYTFRGATTLDLTGVANSANNAWEVTASSAVTLGLVAGLHQWTAYVESGTERYPVLSGAINVLPNPITATSGDLQSFAEKSLALVEAALQKRYAADMASYSIAERAVQREELASLEAARSRLVAEIEAKRSRAFGRRVEWRARSYR